MMAQRRIDSFVGQLVTVSTSTPYGTVRERLFASIARKGSMTPQKVRELAHADQAGFTRLFEEHAGPHGLTHFSSFDHGAWIGLFGIGGGVRLERVILGNGLVAKTMLEHDLNVGLFVPIELLLKELEEGRGTEVVYVLPSSLIAGVNKDPRLVAAVEKLDAKLTSLIDHITTSG